MIMAEPAPWIKRMAISPSTLVVQIKAIATSMYVKSPARIKGFRPFLSESVPNQGRKTAREREKAPKIIAT